MNFQSIKQSFIKKLFLSLSVFYVILFVLSLLFQTLFLRDFIVKRTIDKTTNEIHQLFDNVDPTNIGDAIVTFSQETQTTSILVNSTDFSESINSLSLYLITVTSGDTSYDIYVPNLKGDIYQPGFSVSATLVYYQPTGGYVPINLIVDNHIILNSPDNRINHIYEEFLRGLDPTQILDINGTISSIVSAVPSTASPVNPIISNEILNILSKNYSNLTMFSSNGFYYTSYYESTGVSNLVFSDITQINHQQYVLISVYPMSHIDDIVHTVSQFNIYIFIIIFLALFVSAYIYSKRFSQPLLYINNATKKLSHLDFSDNLITIKSQDEFRELAENINTLSVNLKTTLSQLNEQNKSLSNSLEQENKNEERRRQFISGMSHELKTPLSIIQAAAEGLQKGVFKSDDAKTKQRTVIQDEVQKINKMLQDMITVYKLDSPEYMESWVALNVKDIVLKVSENLSLLYTSKQIQVDLKLEDCMIIAQAEKLELIISNLFNNAIKYTPAKQQIQVFLKQKTKYIEFEIINYGITIDKEDANHIFDAFYRVDNARNREDGSIGLGLYIVKQSLAQFDSKCTVKPVENGVSFSFRLQKQHKKETTE